MDNNVKFLYIDLFIELDDVATLIPTTLKMSKYFLMQHFHTSDQRDL